MGLRASDIIFRKLPKLALEPPALEPLTAVSSQRVIMIKNPYNYIISQLLIKKCFEVFFFWWLYRACDQTVKKQCVRSASSDTF